MLSEINKGTISRLLNQQNHQQKLVVMSIKQLDSITKALDLDSTFFYRDYIEAIFLKTKSDWRQVSEVIFRCLQEDQTELVELVLKKLMEDTEHLEKKSTELMRKRINQVFMVAEGWLKERKLSAKQLLPLYKFVIEKETNNHSESIGVSQYRIFKSHIRDDSLDAMQRYEYSFTFAIYRTRLPRNLALDALMELATQFYILENWKDCEKYADELIQLANDEYDYQKGWLPYNQNIDIDAERTFAKYYGQGYLLKSVALEKQEKYDDALYYVKFYRDLSHLRGIDEEGKKEIEQFKLFAEANFYLLSILKGDNTLLKDYSNFLHQHPNEVPVGITAIIASANKYNWTVDDILRDFNLFYEFKEFNDQRSYYMISVQKIEYNNFLYHMAKYMCRHHRYHTAIESALQCLELATKLNVRQRILNLIGLMVRMKKHCNDFQLMRFEKLISEVNDDEEIDQFNCDRV